MTRARFLTVPEVLLIHADQIDRYGGAVGLRDVGLLESAVAQPAQSFDGADLHRGLFVKAAAYLFFLCTSHPFVDGNKRVALASALVFLDLNGVLLEDPTDQLYEAVMKTARGESSVDEIARKLESLVVP